MKVSKWLADFLFFICVMACLGGVMGRAQSLTVLHAFDSTDGATPEGELVQVENKLYGTSSSGGDYGYGTVFSMNLDGTGYTVLYSLQGFNTFPYDGANPVGALVVSGDTLYGTTTSGGDNFYGTVFSIKTDGTGYALLYSFTGGSDGSVPNAGLISSGNTLYGVASQGGDNGDGTVFSLNTDGTGFATLYSFTGSSDGSQPMGGLILSGNILYGTTYSAGAASAGTVFSIETNGADFTTLYTFTGGSDGANSLTSLTLDANGMLYGTAYDGGDYGGGTVFSLRTNGTSFTTLHSFTNSPDGAYPQGRLLLMAGMLYGTTVSGSLNSYGSIYSLNPDGTGYNQLFGFGYDTNGASPFSGLILVGTRLCGTASTGGDNSSFGTLFSLEAPAATPQITSPAANSLVTNSTSTVTGTLNTDTPVTGVYYSLNGGAWALVVTTNDWADWSVPATFIFGTNIFSVYATDADGRTSFTNTIPIVYGGLFQAHAFDGTHGANPGAGLVALGNKLYGTTESGGLSGNGTVFSINADGSGYAVLYNFMGYPDGANPQGQLVASDDGTTLYGTTTGGGTSFYGTVYSIHTDGSGYTNLYSFTGSTDGANPQARLVLSGGTLYGTTDGGGNSGQGTVFSLGTDGSGFTVLYSFVGTPDAANPQSGLTMSGSTLYGVTYNGGDVGQGAVYTLQTNGSGYQVLYSFTGATDGGQPQCDLLLSGSTLYGTAGYGGDGGYGTVFSLGTDGSGFTVLHTFMGAPDGASPRAGLILSGTTLIGTTYNGGAGDLGTVFSVLTNGASFNLLYSPINLTEGGYPAGEMVLSGGILYGMLSAGSPLGCGTIFLLANPVALPVVTSPGVNELVTHASGFITGTMATSLLNPGATVTGVYYSLNGDAWTLVQTTNGWANWSAPTSFPFGTNTLSVYAVDDQGRQSSPVTYQFAYTHITSPTPNAVLFTNMWLLAGTAETNVPVAGVYYSLNGGAWTLAHTTNDWYDWSAWETIVPRFNTLSVYVQDVHGVDSATNTIQFNYAITPVLHSLNHPPKGALVLLGGKFYGAANNSIFSINPDGSGYTQIGTLPVIPVWGLVGAGNMLYGATSDRVFAVNTNGSGYTVLCTGLRGCAGVVLAGSMLCGATDDGDQLGGVGPGTLFAINTNGIGFTRLHTFVGSDGDSPRANMIAIDGMLYGTTTGGGANSSGTVFAIDTNGANFRVICSFPEDSITSESALTLAGSTLYGLVSGSNSNFVFSVGIDGTGFTILYDFINSAGGRQYNGLAVSGNTLYGTFYGGGLYGYGEIFRMQTNGIGFTDVYDFTGSPDGANPLTDLFPLDGRIYGLTSNGGSNGGGTFFGFYVTSVLTAGNPLYNRNNLAAWQFKVSDLLTNAVDAQGVSFVLASVGTSTNGVTPTVRHGYVQYYNPSLVDDQFTYTVTNSIGSTATGTITLAVAPASPLGGQINHLSLVAGAATIDFAGVPNYRYQVQVSVNLTDWTTLETTNAPANGRFQFIDPNPPQPDAFYRLLWNGN